MEYISGLGLQATASRLRALSDRFYALADDLYERAKLPLQSRWLPVLRLLHDRGPASVGEIATAIGQTHSAVSQLAKKLLAGGWLETVASADRRERRLAVTAKAIAAMREARPIWHGVEQVLKERFTAAQIDMIKVLDELSGVFDGDLIDAIAARADSLRADAIEIVPFRPELRDAFYRLNADWIRRFFHLEEVDHKVLSDPEGSILAGGGAVFFALSGERVVGTCALMPTEPGVFELTKMAVDPSAQGLGIGRKLIEHAIAAYQQMDAKLLFLETNSRLAPAIRLYETSGFVHTPKPEPSHYQRADVYMVWHKDEPAGGSVR
jgi:ribosomal protein S18 acetylase RimI-like enzyme